MRCAALNLALVMCGWPLAAQQPGAPPGCATPEACFTLARNTFNGQGVARDPVRSYQLFSWACERQHFPSCIWVGFQLENGHGVSRDVTQALRYYERACTGAGNISDKEGCAYLGDLYRRGSGVAADPERAWRLNTIACEANVAHGCAQRGYQLQAGAGVRRDSAAAVGEFERACQLNNAGACRALAWVFQEGQAGVPRDLERAAALFKQNCDLRSDGASCMSIGYAYQYGLGVDSNAVTAVRYYAQSCQADQAAGCGNLAYMHANGLGTARDSAAAFASFDRGCRLNGARSCTDLGFILQRGASGTPRDLTRAAQLYDRACALGDLVGCRNFGLALQNGDGVERDPVRAMGFFTRACDGGLGSGCNSLGWALYQGIGTAVNQEQARRHYETGCRRDDQYACTNLARMLRVGQGGPAEPARALELLERGCTTARLPYACYELGFSFQYGHGTRISDQRAIAHYRTGCQGGWEDACQRLRQLAPNDTVTVANAPATGRPGGAEAGASAQAGGEARAREGKVWLLSIGISSYQADSSRIRPLRFADTDALAIYQYLIGPNGPGIDPERRFLLQNRQATATAIREHLTGSLGLGGTLEQDTVIIFLAGHGTPDPQNPRAPPYFLAWDSDPERLASTALPMNDLESAIATRLRAGYIVVLADACHGGGIARAGSQANQVVNTAIRSLTAADRSRAIIAVTSASENETAAESPAYGGGHGLFTWQLLEGLKGVADRNADGGVTLDELLGHLQRAVPAARSEQHPNYHASPNASLTFRVVRKTAPPPR